MVTAGFRASLLVLIAAASGSAACSLERQVACAQCDRQQLTGEQDEASCESDGSDGDGDDGSDGGKAAECDRDVQCDDSNECTRDACVSGACARTPQADGYVVGMLGCLSVRCEGGVEVGSAASAGTFCEGTRLCDGKGSCVGCHAGVACPEGYGCSSSGACASDLGATCGSATSCASGHCVGGRCCAMSCGPCQTCDEAQGFQGCAFLPAFAPHPACADNEVCNGAGACRLVEGEACFYDQQCASNNCAQTASVPRCAL